MTQTQDALKPYTFHGLHLTLNGENAIGECYACGKPGFGIKVKTGQFKCVKCGEEGNIYSFIEGLWTASRSGTKTPKALVSLAGDRSLPIDELLTWGFAVSRIDNAIIVPMYNSKGRMSNLCRLILIDGHWEIRGTTSLKLHPFGNQLLRKGQDTLWVAEGLWDAIALSAALRQVRSTNDGWINHSGNEAAIKSHGVIGVPGANSFAVDWLQYFHNRTVNLVYDNDHPRKQESGKTITPGWDGMQRTIRIASENTHTAKQINVLHWGPTGIDPELNDGYDIRDLITNDPDFPACDALTFLTEHLQEATITPGEKRPEVIDPIECTSFKELCKHYAEVLHFPITLRQTLAVAITTVISTNVDFDSEQLWFRIIGPPGSTKTTIAECLSVAREMCFPKSILTGFHSGMSKGTNGDGKGDSSLIPLMNGKCVIMKDADTLTSAGNRDVILSELRDIYDGSSRSHYRTGKATDYEDLRTTFLLCGTDALRGLNRSFLGERFLDCDIVGDSDTGQYLDAAITSAFSSMEKFIEGEPGELKGSKLTYLKQVTYGFLLHCSQRIAEGNIQMPTYTNLDKVKIKALAHFLSYTRAKVERDNSELAYRPRVDLATRVTKQFVKLAVCLCIVLDKASLDKEVMGIVTKVARDTAQGFTYEIAEYLYGKPKGAQIALISQGLNLAETTVKRLIGDMAELSLVSRYEEQNNSGVGGRFAHYWVLSPEVRELFRLIRIGK